MFIEKVAQSHFKEHLHLEGCETVAFLDSRIALEKRSSSDPPTDPLNRNHLTLGGDEGRVRVLLHKGSFNTCKRVRILSSVPHIRLLSTEHGVPIVTRFN